MVSSYTRVFTVIDKEEREGAETNARPGTVRVVNGWRNRPENTFSLTEHGEERKTTPKMKPHRVRKLFQVAHGHIIKIITIL